MSKLQRSRNRLLGPYVGFVLMFVSCGAMAGTGHVQSQLGLLLVLMLTFSLPVIALNISLHKSIKRVAPGAGSCGVKQTLVSCLLLTPIEAALVLPAINLTIANRILRGGGPPNNKSELQGAFGVGQATARPSLKRYEA